MLPRTNLRLVSFDGSGGARTFSQLRIMGQIMHQLSYNSHPNELDKVLLPCEHFDLMGGSGTGGLIAIMFARLRMSVEEVSDEFFTIVEEVYKPEHLSPSARIQKLRERMGNLMEKKGLPIDMKLIEKAEPGYCASFVLTSPRIDATNKVCLRTYPLRSQLASPITIIEAVLATCAVQPKFSSVTCGSGYNKKEYIAAILGASNPVREVITEAHSLFGGESSVASLFSLGAGHPGVISFPSSATVNLHSVMRNMMDDCEQRAQEMERQIGRVGIYFRFSVEQGMQSDHLGPVADIGQVVSQTESYIAEHWTDKKINNFMQTFDAATRLITLAELEYSGGASVSKSTLEARLAVLESSHDNSILTKLKIAELECGPHTAQCMAGTRQDILDRIHAWAADPHAPNILWLKGHPGVGKSAIASSIVEQLGTKKRLGSSFFFQRQKANVMTTSALWRMVAYDLARQYLGIRDRLIATLKADETVPTISNIDKLFRLLIQEPILANAEIPGESSPVVVVDALDECGGLAEQHSEVRRSLMRTLESWSSLPAQFKLIVTSRDESDIARVFSRTNHHPIEILAGHTVQGQSSEDIRMFLTRQFQRQIVDEYDDTLSPDWPGPRIIEKLADRAAGLFIWAQTVVNFIGLGEPQHRLNLVLKGSGTGDMNSLYSQILSTSFGHANEEEIEKFRCVVETIILAELPLSLTTLRHLLSMEAPAVKHVCNRLKSVMESKDTLRFHHQSFVDYLIDPERCPPMFLIKRELGTRNLTVACLRAMKENLRFNICDLKSSYLRNADIPNLDSLVEQCIPSHVSYSSRFWASHLSEGPFHIDVFEALQYFMENQFLFWLEVSSLTKHVNIASNMLLSLINWIQAGGQDDALARDMRRFVAGFSNVIAQSAPHIYLSALPFSPRNSAVSEKYRDRFPRTLAIQTGGLSSWPAIQNVLSGHSGPVNSVACTPDGRHIVSGSDDRTIRVWDAETGQVIVGPLEGHHSDVRSVAFSPDGQRIVSGSEDRTIRVWDAKTGEALAGPFKEHSEGVLSAAFSPDRTHIVSGSRDCTIRVWNAETGEPILGPLEGHNKDVMSVAFSPDGTRVASGSEDCTIRVWGAKTGEVLAAPFNGHSDWVSSVAFSPKGRHIVSGSYDMTIRVWDSMTGEVVAGPFRGHGHWVQSVAFSPDGTRIVSGSSDRTIRVWDAETGKEIAGPFNGHTNPVCSVAFLPGGRRIVSGSADHTIRVWDSESGLADVVPFEGHSGSIESVAFSPDGASIISGSSDNTIRAWDAETSEPILGPLEGHSERVSSIAFSPDGTRIISGSWDHTIRVWDVETGQVVVGPLEEHKHLVTSVAFSPDGKHIASGSWDKTIWVWDAETGKVVKGPFKGHSHSVSSVAFSPDGNRVVSGSWDTTLRVWDAATGGLVAGPFKGHNGWIRSVALSPDGRRIVSGSNDKTIRVWDFDTAEVSVGPLTGHTDQVWSVAFSPDGKYIVSGSTDHTIRMWDAGTGKMVAGPFSGHNQGVNSVAFSPDGGCVVSGSSDKTIRVWNTMIGDSTVTETSPFKEASEMSDGWILGPNSELAFWVPPSLREGLFWPNNRSVIGNLITTKLDLAHFVHGDSWSQCKE